MRWELSDLLNFTVADAGGADPQPSTGAFDQRANRLQVQVPPAFRDIVSVADAVPELGTPATDFASFRHDTEISVY
jgi:hypothetical protein